MNWEFRSIHAHMSGDANSGPIRCISPQLSKTHLQRHVPVSGSRQLRVPSLTRGELRMLTFLPIERTITWNPWHVA
jgi:hypothetical protein